MRVCANFGFGNRFSNLLVAYVAAVCVVTGNGQFKMIVSSMRCLSLVSVEMCVGGFMRVCVEIDQSVAR